MVTKSFEEISEAIDQFLEVMHKHETMNEPACRLGRCEIE